MANTEQRDRVRELVRQVLSTVPTEGEPSPAPAVERTAGPEHVLVNSLRDRADREFDRDESARALITEEDLRGLEQGARLRVGEGAKFTALAQDLIDQRGIELITKKARASATKVRSAAIGSDHGGFAYKEKLKSVLSDLGIQVRDFGTTSAEAVDYPDFAHSVATAVSRKQVDVGIVIDGAGIGSAMTANKVPGVRAAACYSEVLARNSREHNGANVLTLGAGQNSFDEVRAIVEAFLSTEISEERHKKRVGKIESIDRTYRV